MAIGLLCCENERLVNPIWRLRSNLLSDSGFSDN